MKKNNVVIQYVLDNSWLHFCGTFGKVGSRRAWIEMYLFFQRFYFFFSSSLSHWDWRRFRKMRYFSKGRRRPWLFWPLEEMAPSHPILNRFPRSTHKHPPNQSVLTIHLLRHFDFNVLIILELDEKMALDFVPLHSMAFPS